MLIVSNFTIFRASNYVEQLRTATGDARGLKMWALGREGAEAMIKVKHFLDAIEPDDGRRIWIEPIGLTADLRDWCKVDHVVCHIGPPRELWEWFAGHPQGYDYFRGRYHTWLSRSQYKSALRQLACAAVSENITLLHESDDVEHNTATALYEFLSELEAYCQPDAEEK